MSSARTESLTTHGEGRAARFTSIAISVLSTLLLLALAGAWYIWYTNQLNPDW